MRPPPSYAVAVGSAVPTAQGSLAQHVSVVEQGHTDGWHGVTEYLIHLGSSIVLSKSTILSRTIFEETIN